MADQPNLLYICTDQLAHDALSCAGNPDLATPNIDRLSSQGVRFTNAYCTFPLCTPSRMSMVTGRMPAELGINSLQGDIREELRDKEMGPWFSKAGYTCAYGGKWHAGGGLDYPEGSDHGFEKICTINDLELPGACDAFLKRNHDRPFLLVASFDDPHNICEHRKNQVLPWGSIDDVPVDEYPNLPANFSRAPQEPQAIRNFRSGSGGSSALQMAEAYTSERWRKHRYYYFRIVERVDALIGRVLHSLEESGHADDTLVIFSSDHGEMNASHELTGKFVLYDESVRIPLIVRTPGRDRAGEIDENLASAGLDLMPTLCDYAGIDRPDHMPGYSLRPLLNGDFNTDWRSYVAAEAAFDRTPTRMVRSERYKYLMHQWGEYREQLFDLHADPGERINLSVEKKHAETLNQHRTYMAEWLSSIGDRAARSYAHPGCVVVPGVEPMPMALS